MRWDGKTFPSQDAWLRILVGAARFWLDPRASEPAEEIGAEETPMPISPEPTMGRPAFDPRSPAASGGTLFVCTEGGKAEAYRIKDGELL